MRPKKIYYRRLLIRIVPVIIKPEGIKINILTSLRRNICNVICVLNLLKTATQNHSKPHKRSVP